MGKHSRKAVDYFERAQKRALRRKSPWNILLFVLWPVILVFLWGVTLSSLHALFREQPCPGNFLRCLPQGGATVVFVIAPFFPLIGLSMFLANCILWLIPPARRVLDHEASAHPSTSFLNSQKQFLIYTAASAAALVPVSILALKWM